LAKFKVAGKKAGGQSGEKLPGEYREIPSLYYRVETSKLTYTVTPGAQKKDIALKRRERSDRDRER
jgi:hypothetical protein